MAHRLLIATGLAVVTILRVIGSALYQPDDGERVSTWSIRKRDARIFFLLLYGLWIAGAFVLAYSQYSSAPPSMIKWATLPPHVGDGALYVVIQRLGSVAVPLMVVALVMTPTLTSAGRIQMSLSQFINEKILDPIIEAKAVAPRLEHRLAEARAEAAAEAAEAAAEAAEAAAEAATEAAAEAATEAAAKATAHTNEQWANWVARRDEALAQGREFNEPRPDAGRGYRP